MRVAVVGVGVAGGVIATGLEGVPGVELLAFEKVGPSDHALAGNGLNIGPNAMLALQAAMPDFAATLRARSLPWQQWRASTVQGELLYEVPLAQVAACDGIRIRWADLYRSCRAQAPGTVRYDAEVVAVHQSPGAGPMQLEVAHADGRREVVAGIDLLIAADGRYSGLRSQLCGPAAVTHLGVANFRVLLDDGGQWPVDDLEQWFHGPHRLLAFRLQGGLVYLSGNLPIDPASDTPAARKTASWLQGVYTPERGGMAAAPRQLLDGACQAAQAGQLHWSRLQEATVCWTDPTGRVLFPGDAGHPMVPTLGQGATTAIEDAALFVMHLRAALSAKVRAPLHEVTASYVAQRQDRIEFIRQLSWSASDVLLADRFTLDRVRAKGGAAHRADLERLYALR